MSYTPPQLKASENIRSSRFVTISGNHQAAEADANEVIIGVTYQSERYAPIPEVSTNYHAISGDTVELYTDGQICLLTYATTVTAGQRLKSDADGQGTPVTGSGSEEVGAIALEGGAAGEKRLVKVTCFRQTT